MPKSLNLPSSRYIREAWIAEVDRWARGLDSEGSLVDNAIIEMEDEHGKIVLQVSEKTRKYVFCCSDGEVISRFSSSILERTFHLIRDLFSSTEKVESISVPFTSKEIRGALWGVKMKSAIPRLDPYAKCIDFLQPIDSTYYLRYNVGSIRDRTLLHKIGRLIPEEVSLSGDLLPRAFSPSSDLSTLLHLLGKKREIGVIEYLCQDRPSTLIPHYVCCRAHGKIVKLITSNSFDDYVLLGTDALMMIFSMISAMMLCIIEDEVTIEGVDRWDLNVSMLKAIGLASSVTNYNPVKITLPHRISVSTQGVSIPRLAMSGVISQLYDVMKRKHEVVIEIPIAEEADIYVTQSI